MKYHAIDPRNMKYHEKPDGSRVWELTRAQAMTLSDGAIMVALDEPSFNGSLNCYYEQRLFKLLHYDERNGWIS